MILAIAVAIAWATSPDPRGNPASFEDAPLDPGLASLDEALTLASYATADGGVATLLVTGSDEKTVSGVDLAGLGASRTGNPLRDLAGIQRERIDEESIDKLPQVSVAIADLLPAAPGGDRHIGTGTNFPEHAEEANSSAVFQFPKFGKATPARTSVKARSGILLDYEVELCMRFDRDIASLADFDAALKGLFLCGDFTDRNALVELADPDNLDSGYGFSDAKSGPNSFPSGPFIVVPRDWKAFAETVRMTTAVNGEARQDARGAEMTLDFRELAERALADMDRERFFYEGSFFRLAPDGRIGEDMTLMSGTSEGVIFTPPSRADYIEGVLAWALAGGPLSETGLVDTVKRRFVENELETQHFLQPGDTVIHGSNRLGTIEVRVVG
ncbi:fumarylacetoacetate hydrolase family protein [Erythrobacter sp. GH1-10]|uniref:fumarylacetoacetate hydrolase family protein n=1 Tax=Erythrobacter sp. GH1-10 TaxID=3349334 RepID=UPI003877904F